MNTNRCRMCHTQFQADKQYCPKCGTKVKILVNTSLVRVTWGPPVFQVLEKLKIYMDDIEIGSVKFARTAEFEIEPREHDFFVKTSFYGSEKLRVVCKNESIIDLIAGMNGKVIIAFQPKKAFSLKVFSE